MAVFSLMGRLLWPALSEQWRQFIDPGLHALAVLVALLAGFHLGGVVGGLVAVPFLAGAWEVVRTLWVEPRRS